MGVVSPAEFERCLSRLGSEEFVSFVADLWSVKGEVLTVGEDVIVSSTGIGRENEKVYACHRPVLPRVRIPVPVNIPLASEELADIDVLVTNVESDRLRAVAESNGTEYVGPGRLRTLMLYAIDRDECDELFRGYFDRPVDVRRDGDPPADRTGVGAPGAGQVLPFGNHRLDRELISSGLTAGVVIALVVAVFVLPIVSVTGPPDRPLEFERAASSGGTVGQTPGIDRENASYPPGIGASGLENATVLGRAHVDEVEQRNYRLTIRHEGTRGLAVTSSRWRRSRQRIEKRSSDRYRYAVDGVLPPATIGASPWPVQFDLTVRGSECTGRPPEVGVYGSRADPCALVGTNDTTPFAPLTAAYLDRYLETEGSTVRAHQRGSRTKYRVVVATSPDDWPIPTTNYTAVAIVDESGLVRELSVTYETPVADRLEVVSFLFRFDMSGTVSRNPRRSQTDRSAGRHHVYERVRYITYDTGPAHPRRQFGTAGSRS